MTPSIDDCAWCGTHLSAQLRKDAKHCSKRCRQAAHRFGRAAVAARAATHPLRLAYADPPYPGLAERYYADHPDYAGEVDHADLLSRLQLFDGWALSTSSLYLPELLSLCVQRDLSVRVASWIRGARPGRSLYPRRAWEPIVYSGGRRAPSDALQEATDALVHTSRPRLTDPQRVIGAKPAAFAFWLFRLLGASPDDAFVDLFPGSGGIGRAWEIFSDRELLDASSRCETFDTSDPGENDTSDAGVGDASPRARADASRSAAANVSPRTGATRTRLRDPRRRGATLWLDIER